MTKRSFIAAEKRIDAWWETLLKESMKLTGQEECEKAIAKNSVFQGDPAITVILDGGWSKRSHKHSYNVKCGVGIIIGLEIQKILFMGVRNKYCAVCNQSTNNDQPEHECYKNWETDIIVEGFKKCIEQHSVKYTKFIGDGDSSVYSTLISSVPWGYAIEKLECANHAVKCYRTALERLVQDKPSYRGKGKLTESMRKRLTKAARCAIVMRNKESNKLAAIEKLQQDLLNGPLHCCKTAQKTTNNATQHDSNLPLPSLQCTPSPSTPQELLQCAPSVLHHNHQSCYSVLHHLFQSLLLHPSCHHHRQSLQVYQLIAPLHHYQSLVYCPPIPLHHPQDLLHSHPVPQILVVSIAFSSLLIHLTMCVQKISTRLPQNRNSTRLMQPLMNVLTKFEMYQLLQMKA